MDAPYSVGGEEWRPVVGLPAYRISNFGRVWSSHRCGKILKLYACKRRGKPASIIATLRNTAGKTILRSVHQLVLEAFVGPCPDGMEGCHNDGNGTNNTLSNLRWDTHAANMRDSMAHGTFVPIAIASKGKRAARRGSKNERAKLTEQQVAEIDAGLKAGRHWKQLADEFNTTYHTIAHIADGSSWGWLTKNHEQPIRGRVIRSQMDGTL